MSRQEFPDRGLPDAIWIVADGQMNPGFYRSRLVRGGPFVPVRFDIIAPDLDEAGEPLWDFVYELEVNGERKDPFEIRALAGEPIDEAEYRHMMAMREHAIRYEPAMPQANPRKPVDWNTLRFRFGET